jgi:hypothetical protein
MMDKETTSKKGKHLEGEKNYKKKEGVTIV